MTGRKMKSTASWSDVKAKLADFDRAGLLALVQDMYAASKDNQIFLHARFGLGEDVLKPYKVTIDRWLCPDVYKNQDYAVAKAKKPIADYKKAIGQPAGLGELMVFYCEQSIGFSSEFGLDDEGYYSALVRMFEQALKVVVGLPEPQRETFSTGSMTSARWGRTWAGAWETTSTRSGDAPAWRSTNEDDGACVSSASGASPRWKPGMPTTSIWRCPRISRSASIWPVSSSSVWCRANWMGGSKFWMAHRASISPGRVPTRTTR
jgi:hypothetical protein